MHNAAEHECHFSVRLVAKRATSGQVIGQSVVSQEKRELGAAKWHANGNQVVESNRR